MTAQKYRKKPVEIEALHFDGTEKSGQGILNWMLASPNRKEDATLRETYVKDESGDVLRRIPSGKWELLIYTLEGTMRADAGDVIIRGVQGEFYPCKPDIFEATYEKVSD